LSVDDTVVGTRTRQWRRLREVIDIVIVIDPD